MFYNFIWQSAVHTHFCTAESIPTHTLANQYCFARLQCLILFVSHYLSLLLSHLSWLAQFDLSQPVLCSVTAPDPKYTLKTCCLYMFKLVLVLSYLFTLLIFYLLFSPLCLSFSRFNFPWNPFIFSFFLNSVLSSFSLLSARLLVSCYPCIY